VRVCECECVCVCVRVWLRMRVRVCVNSYLLLSWMTDTHYRSTSPHPVVDAHGIFLGEMSVQDVARGLDTGGGGSPQRHHVCLGLEKPPGKPETFPEYLSINGQEGQVSCWAAGEMEGSLLFDENTLPSHFVWLIWRQGLFAQAGLHRDPPILCCQP
jgi:hypothetical protein